MREINTADLAQHPLFIATPMYGGQCSSIYAKGVSDLAIVSTHYGLRMATAFLGNESLIPRARNVLADFFLKSPCEHLMFIDADIGFRAQDVLELLILQIQHPEYDIIGAPYKVKSIFEDRYAFQMTTVQADKASIENAASVQGITEPIEVSGIGTGFMLIRKSVFLKFQEAFPDYKYIIDTIVEGDGGGKKTLGQEMRMFFHAEIDPVTHRYLSEDYWFSRRCQEIGIRTWLCPWMPLRHAGTHFFE